MRMMREGAELQDKFIIMASSRLFITVLTFTHPIAFYYIL